MPVPVPVPVPVPEKGAQNVLPASRGVIVRQDINFTGKKTGHGQGHDKEPEPKTARLLSGGFGSKNAKLQLRNPPAVTSSIVDDLTLKEEGQNSFRKEDQ